jgi:molybdenum cofactor biosynthesis enzyme MoaA
LHDIGRIDDNDRKREHALKGSLIAKSILKKYFREYGIDHEKIIYAIKHHSDGTISDDPLIGTIWDADRLDLGRIGVKINPTLLSTAAAKKICDTRNKNFKIAEKEKMRINKKISKERDAVAQEKKHWVRLTSVCNNSCIFCLDKDRLDGKIISKKDIIKELEKGRKEGATRVVLSGGEPTLHPEITDIIQEAKKIGYRHVQIISNGRMLAYRNFAHSLKEAGLDEITLSLHSHLKGKFEQMTRAKGSYEQAMAGLSNALAEKFIVSVDIVVSKINYKTLAQSMVFFIGRGVNEFDLLQIMPFGRSWDHREELFYDYADAKEYLDKAFELGKNKDLHIWTNRFPASYLEGNEQLIQHPSKIKGELGGENRDFQGYLAGGKLISCHGEKCRTCFLKNFCEDLVELRKKGKLSGLKNPVCTEAGNENEKTKEFMLKKNSKIEDFADFYIKNRYFLKGSQCTSCIKNKNCHGAHIDTIRRNGFKTMNPILKKSK